MLTRRVLELLAFALVVVGCAEPNKFDPNDVARTDAQGGASGSQATGGRGGAAGMDAPVSGTGGVMDADQGSDSGGPACNAGATRCAGAVVEVCTVAGAWILKETCTAVCTAGACAGMCTPNSKHCGTEQTPETCSAQGEWVADAMPCPNVCSGMGQCTGMCKPGSKRCSGANNLTVQTCDENGAWVDGAVCPNLCSSGSCGGECAPTTKRCGANNVLETCGEKGTWEPTMTCPFICMGTACAGECKPGSRQCSALVPQECGTNALWQNMPACPNLCMNGACSGDCVPGQKRCSGNIIQTCSPAGRYVASETCPSVCRDGACSGQCMPGQRQCSGTTPQVCSNDGVWMNTTGNECLKPRGETCGSASECVTGACVSGGRCCSSGEKYCDGQCRAGGYCCNGNSCSITNGQGSCSGGSCQWASCNSGYERDGNGCTRVCGDSGEACCSGSCNNSNLYCGSNMCRTKKAEGAACGGNSECREGRCAGGVCCQSDCCNNNACASDRACMDGVCVRPSCNIAAADVGCAEVRDHVCVSKRYGEPCDNQLGGRCRPMGSTDASCATPVRSGTECDSNYETGTGNFCFPGTMCVDANMDGHKTCGETASSPPIP